MLDFMLAFGLQTRAYAIVRVSSQPGIPIACFEGCTLCLGIGYLNSSIQLIVSMVH